MASKYFIEKKFGHNAYSFNLDTKEIKTLPKKFTKLYPIEPQSRMLYCGANNLKQAKLVFQIQVTEIMNNDKGRSDNKEQ